MTEAHSTPLPKNARDLTGTRWGGWEVIAYFGHVNRRALWVCRHTCGRTATVRGDRITAGVNQRCECRRLVYRSYRTFRYGRVKEVSGRPKNATELTGHRFGRWLVVAYAGRNPNCKGSRWLCRCDCGTEGMVAARTLMAGDSQSCGCLHRERQAERFGSHGRVDTPEYRAWVNLKQRCRNENHPQYHDWGGRGIRVCDRWADSFELFLADMGPRPTPDHEIDRKENDKGYEPGNCRWATKAEQLRNTRRTLLITFDGETMCLTDWAKRSGLTAQCLAYRIKAGWPLEKALRPQYKPT